MEYQKNNRLSKISFILLVLMISWGIAGTLIAPIGITSFWGLGLGTGLAVLFVFSLYVKKFGLLKTVISFGILLIIVFGTHILNQFRGWPFGYLTYNDILGWRLPLNIAWPIPIFWTSIIASALLLMQPKVDTHDPKTIFTWSFDVGMFVLVCATIIEPILNKTASQTWSIPGGFYGVPLTNLLGWFLTAFVSAYATIYIAKLMNFKFINPPVSLSISLLLLSLLAGFTAYKLSMNLLLIPSVFAFLYFGHAVHLSSRPKPSPPVISTETK